MNIHERMRLLQKLAETIEKQQVERARADGLTYLDNYKVKVKRGNKYYKVDVGSSGKYMVDLEGNIYGIKGYGRIHKGQLYGTLETIDNYYWGKYTAYKKGGNYVLQKDKVL